MKTGMSKHEIMELASRHREAREEKLTDGQFLQYEQVPQRYKSLFAKAYVEKGYATKVKAKGCPLWEVRPYK